MRILLISRNGGLTFLHSFTAIAHFICSFRLLSLHGASKNYYLLLKFFDGLFLSNPFASMSLNFLINSDIELSFLSYSNRILPEAIQRLLSWSSPSDQFSCPSYRHATLFWAIAKYLRHPHCRNLLQCLPQPNLSISHSFSYRCVYVYDGWMLLYICLWIKIENNLNQNPKINFFFELYQKITKYKILFNFAQMCHNLTMDSMTKGDSYIYLYFDILIFFIYL